MMTISKFDSLDSKYEFHRNPQVNKTKRHAQRILSLITKCQSAGSWDAMTNEELNDVWMVTEDEIRINGHTPVQEFRRRVAKQVIQTRPENNLEI
jgi:hypothetical protein